MNAVTRFLTVVFAAVLLLISMPLALAQEAGFDLFQTAAGASVDLRQAGLGTVPLQGVPIEKSLGNTDTIMHRTQNAPPKGGAVPLDVYALFMKSVRPVLYRTPASSGKTAAKSQRVDVYVTINNSGGAISQGILPQPDALSPSQGTITINPNHTFTSKITVYADLIFVRAGGHPGTASDIVHHQAAAPITLETVVSPWSSAPPPGYPIAKQYPSGNFHPRPKHKFKGLGPHPVKPAVCLPGGGCQPAPKGGPVG